MCSLFKSPQQHVKSAGFTLLELLIVISLLAVLAGFSITAYDGVKDDAYYDAAIFEMAEIRNALLQFRRDNDELPCRAYRAGNYNPFTNSLPELDFTTGLASTTAADYKTWCEFSNDAQEDNALSMLQRFPYDKLTEASLLWNRDTKRGWNGPYVSTNDLNDPWGNRYRLYDAELDYPNGYLCEDDGSGGYKVASNEYNCLHAADSAITSAHTLDADIARLVSAGADGLFSGDNLFNICSAATDSDDLVLCLMR